MDMSVSSNGMETMKNELKTNLRKRRERGGKKAFCIKVFNLWRALRQTIILNGLIASEVIQLPGKSPIFSDCNYLPSSPQYNINIPVDEAVAEVSCVLSLLYCTMWGCRLKPAAWNISVNLVWMVAHSSYQVKKVIKSSQTSLA